MTRFNAEVDELQRLIKAMDYILSSGYSILRNNMKEIKFKLKGYRYGEYVTLFSAEDSQWIFNHVNRNLGRFLTEGYSLSAWIAGQDNGPDLCLFSSNKLHDYDVATLSIAAVRAML